jgi:hypothetical protein
MPCPSCGSENLRKFKGEIGIVLPGFLNLFDPTVFVWPELVVCLACGVAQFAVPDRELRLLAKTDATPGLSQG